MEGLIDEAKDLLSEKPEPNVLDAGLISAAQHVEHYEMAGYGTVRTWARLLGYDDQAALLEQTLEEEKATDLLLTDIAENRVKTVPQRLAVLEAHRDALRARLEQLSGHLAALDHKVGVYSLIVAQQALDHDGMREQRV